MPEQELIYWSNIAFDEIERIHHALSFHQTVSDLSKINNALLTKPTTQYLLTADLAKVLQFSEEL